MAATWAEATLDEIGSVLREGLEVRGGGGQCNTVRNRGAFQGLIRAAADDNEGNGDEGNDANEGSGGNYRNSTLAGGLRADGSGLGGHEESVIGSEEPVVIKGGRGVVGAGARAGARSNRSFFEFNFRAGAGAAGSRCEFEFNFRAGAADVGGVDGGIDFVDGGEWALTQR
jgi:hypothetical protein